MSAGGVLEPKADWTANAQKYMKASLQKRKNDIGFSMTELSELDADDVEEISSLHAAVD
jgi:hypothetical protein